MLDPGVDVGRRSSAATASARSARRKVIECCEGLEIKNISYVKRKRIIDIFSSGLALILLLPVFIVLALAVKITSPGPVFYRSFRVGRGGQLFPFVKFRSMRADADKVLEKLQTQNEKDGPIFKMKRDPRITPIGRFLRKYSLDELPQLWSVFVGHMSMVGPRPPIPREVEHYDDFAKRRLTVKPGITCYWQIMGRSNLTFEEWMALDNRYIDEMSFWTDIKIIAKTPKAILFPGDSAY